MKLQLSEQELTHLKALQEKYGNEAEFFISGSYASFMADHHSDIDVGVIWKKPVVQSIDTTIYQGKKIELRHYSLQTVETILKKPPQEDLMISQLEFISNIINGVALGQDQKILIAKVKAVGVLNQYRHRFIDMTLQLAIIQSLSPGSPADFDRMAILFLAALFASGRSAIFGQKKVIQRLTAVKNKPIFFDESSLANLSSANPETQRALLIDISKFMTTFLASNVSLMPASANRVLDELKTVNQNLIRLKPYLNWAQNPVSVEGQLKFAENASEQERENKGLHRMIYDGEHFIGGISLHSVELNPFTNKRFAEVGYWISEEAEGKGFISKAIQEVLLWARINQFEKLTIKTHLNNPRSQSVAIRNQFQKVSSDATYVIFETHFA